LIRFYQLSRIWAEEGQQGTEWNSVCEPPAPFRWLQQDRHASVDCLLAIWEFTGTDILWRTVATCAVIGGGTIASAWVNALFGDRED